MRLYIVRHGEAEGQRTSDAARALTRYGEQQVSDLWQRLAAQGIRPGKVLCSPFVRARQTAERLVACFPGLAIEEWPEITPEGEVQQVIAGLAARGMAESWVLVSHMPLVSLLTAALTDGERYAFPLAGVACIDLEAPLAGAGRLLWLVSPERNG